MHDFHKSLDKELKKLEVTEKRVTDRVAREADWNTAHSNNRREKRQRASAAAAGDGDEGGRGAAGEYCICSCPVEQCNSLSLIFVILANDEPPA